MSTHVEGQSYNAPPIKVTDRDQVEITKEVPKQEVVSEPGANAAPDPMSYSVPELFQNLRTIILARDIGPNEKTSAAKALLHNLKEGSYNAQTYAHQVLLELLTHDRLRGK